MESKINTISDSEREIDVTLNYEEIKDDIESAYLKERKSISMPGFRKGKVPLQMIKKLYGDAIEYRASEDIANKKFWEIVENENLKPISTPSLTDLNYDKGKSLSFKIRYEVLPEITPKDYKGLEIEKPIFKVKEEDIEEELKSILRKEATFEKAEKVENEDYRITLDVQPVEKATGEIAKDAEKQTGVVVNLNDKSIESDIAENAMGKKVGDTFEFNYKYKQTFEGNPITIDLRYFAEIKAIEKFVFPEWNEELCKKSSQNKATNLEELKQYFRDEYKKYFDAESEKIYLDSLLSKVMENNKIDIPKKYTEYYLDKLAEEEIKRTQQSGYKALSKEEMKKKLRQQAEWQVKWDILSHAIAKAENIEVTNDDLKKLAEEESQKTNISVDKLIKYYKDTNRKDTLLEEKVIEFFKENNITKEIDADELKKRNEEKKAEEKEKEAENKEGNKNEE